MGTDWSTQEEEIAAQGRSGWKYLSSQAACADLQEFD